MDKTQIIAEVKSKFLSGNTEKALSELITFLESEDKFEDLANEVLQLKSQFSKIKKDESLGLITYEKAQSGFNRIGKTLTDILERLEKGQLKTPKPQTRSKSGWWIAGVAVILLLVAGLIFKDYIFNDTPDDPPLVTKGCPEFDKTSQFNILLLPFINYGEEIASFEESYRQRFNRFKNTLSFTLDTELYLKQEGEKVAPANSQEAEAYTRLCADTVRLVLWGSYEKKNNGQIITTTNYKFLNIGDLFAFDQINIGGNLEPVTVSSVSSIATAGAATTDIEQLLLGIASQQMGDPGTAIALLGKTAPSDSSTLLLWGMALADSYMEVGDKAKAIESYDKVLEAHPDYRFALLNRAMLKYQTGETAEAIEDLNQQLKNDPKDKTALLSRATIYVKEDQLDKAGKDISDLESDPAERQKVIPLKRDYNKKIKTEIDRKEKAEARLRQDPENIKALNVLSESSIRLGEYQTALTANQKITKIKPDNKKAWANLLYLSRELKMDYKQVIRNANKAGVTNEQLKSNTPKIYNSKTFKIKEIDN
jgi:tetratricopeptide (TPR) repeat protein